MVRKVEPVQFALKTQAQQEEAKKLVSLSWEQLTTGQPLLKTSILKPAGASMSPFPGEAVSLQPPYPLRKKRWTSTGQLHQYIRTRALCVKSL